jgi:hypothetical protein
VVEEQETEKVISDTIAFSPNLTENQAVTRADMLENMLPDGNETFKVWGYKNDVYDEGTSSFTSYQTVMNGYYVNWTANTAGTTTSNSHDWEYVGQEEDPSHIQTIKFWDWSAKAYRFFAVAPSDASVTADMDGSGDSYTITLPADAEIEASDAILEDKIAATPYYSRLWFSTGNTVDYPTRQFGKPVVLEFIKPLARVRFMFIYSYPPESIKLKEKEFKPSDGSKIACKGSVTISYPLRGTGTNETFSVAAETGAGSGELAEFTEDYIEEGTRKWYTVLPAVSQDSYTLSVKVNNTPRTAVVPANYMTWLPGYSYTYVFKITEQGGVEIEMVQAAVIKWGDPYHGDYTVYNW